MENSFDIIIVGGGPSGLSCASELADSQLNTLLIDNRSTSDKTNFDVKATSLSIINELSLDESILSKQTNFGMYSRKMQKIFRYKKHKVCVVNLQKALEILRKRTKCKCENSTVLKVKKQKNSITVFDDKDKAYKATLLIDCSGNSFVTANSLGLEKPKVLYHCVSLVLSNCKIPSNKVNEMSLYMDMSVCNSAVWFYPIDSNSCQIGLGEMAPYKIVSDNQLLDSLKKFRDLRPYKEMLNKAKIREDTIVFGHSPVIQPLHKMQLDNIIFAGDSAGMATPLVGDGFRPALIGGRNAGIVAKKAFKIKDFSEKTLEEHEHMWWSRFGQYYIWTIILRHIICKYFDVGDWDKVINQLKDIGEKEFWEIINSRLTFNRLKKLINFKMIIDILSDDIVKFVPHLSIFNKKYGTSTII